VAPTTRFPAAGQTGNQPVLLSSVRKAFFITIFLALFSALPLRAQFVDASRAGGPITLNALWRFHTGDNPEWAFLAFDDSQWSLLRMDKPWDMQGYGGYSGYAWYRIRMQLPVSKEPLALGLNRVGSSAEIYADGKLIGVMGRMQPTPDWLNSLPQNIAVIPLPVDLYGRTIEVAMRVWESPRSAPFFGAGSADPPQLGTEQAIRQLHNLTVNQSLLTYLPDLFVALVAVVIGQISFGLFFLRPRATEYAWAGLYLLGEALIRGFDVYRHIYELPVYESVLALESIRAGVTICWLFLIWGFMHARADWLLRAGILLAFCPPIATLLVSGGFATIAEVYVIRAFVSLCIGILIFVRLVHWAWQGNRDAQVFLVPFLLYSVMDVVRWIRRALYYAGLFNTYGGLELYKGAYFTVTWDRVGFLLSFLAIGAVLVRRFAHSAEQEQRLASEMESARQIQAQLVPVDLPHLTGFNIEAAYLPAAEVGGDFYQVLEQGDGSVLIVIGDVCGKGLKAAMTGALAIGAIRTLASQGFDPGWLLTRLNWEIARSQNGGFITCICARVCHDGAITLANAGHPPPYRNGEEIQLKSCLPLGITPDVEYAQTSFQLVPGDRLTFLSDGVVEARGKTGGFFGFERTQEVSRQPARAIAYAAQQFGQEDDITVLTLSFTPLDVVPA
jgi:hypothetical protein